MPNQYQPTVNVTNGSATVTIPNVDARSSISDGDWFGVNGDGTPSYQVATSGVSYSAPDTTVTLTAPYNGLTASGVQGVFTNQFTNRGFVILGRADLETASLVGRLAQQIDDEMTAMEAAADAAYEPKLQHNSTTTDPTVTDDDSAGYSVRSSWINTSSGEIFRCIDNTTGAAVWVKTSFTLDELGSMASQDADTVAVTGGAVDGTTIGGTTPAAGTFTTVTANTGIYLGGTAAANLLDDYEEGTWTPTLIASSTDFDSVTYDAGTGGKYTKIGDVCFVQGVVRTDAVTIGSAAGEVRISNLPFTVANSDGSTFNGYSSAAMGYSAGFAGNVPSSALFRNNSVAIAPYYRATASGNSAALDPATDISTGANANTMYFSGAYKTA